MKQIRKIILHAVRIVLNPAILVFVVVGTIGFELFMNFNLDTIYITNAAFLAGVAIAGVCFSFARVLDEKKSDRALVIYSAEMFLSASFSLLLISIFKLSFQGLLSNSLIIPDTVLYSAVRILAMIYISIFLITSAVCLYFGLNCICYYLSTKLFIIYSAEEQEAMYSRFLKKYTG